MATRRTIKESAQRALGGYTNGNGKEIKITQIEYDELEIMHRIHHALLIKKDANPELTKTKALLKETKSEAVRKVLEESLVELEAEAGATDMTIEDAIATIKTLKVVTDLRRVLVSGLTSQAGYTHSW